MRIWVNISFPFIIREHADSEKGQVRNLGKPVDLFTEGVDEICSCPLRDLPMLKVLRRARPAPFPDGSNYMWVFCLAEYPGYGTLIRLIFSHFGLQIRITGGTNH